MTRARLPISIPQAVSDLAPDIPGEILNEAFRAACERLDRFIGALVGELADTLVLPRGFPVSPAGLIAARGWSQDGALAVRWLLETLETYGLARARDGGWEVDAAPPREAAAAELAREAIALLPGVAPTYRVFELCAEALPAVLAGTASGEATLFSPATLGLWFDYFSNSNPHYALNNGLVATALVRAVVPAAAIVELGGGGGSAAQAVLAALIASGKPPRGYHFTELHPAFLRRGARVAQAAAPAGCTVTSARFDIDGDPAAQGIVLGRADAVVAVNTLHLARDLVPTLARLRTLLRPDGVLVVGELLRPAPLAGVHIELPFTLLEAYRGAQEGDDMRPRPGFMAADGWRRALLAAGFERVVLLPAALSRCVDLYPGFYCGAITAACGPCRRAHESGVVDDDGIMS